MAAHFANRYAGSLPMEGMSKIARQIANVMLFSRSFTLGNLAAYKDITRGLPSDVRAQIARDSGAERLERVQGVARQKAVGMLALDIALQYAGLFLVAGAIAWLTHQKFQSPLDNEEGKQNRVLLRYQADGTVIYGRLPTGKVAEDMQNWVTDPIGTLKAKLSPYGRLAYELATNDTGFGRKLYDPYDHTPVGLAKNVGRVIWRTLPRPSPRSTKLGGGQGSRHRRGRPQDRGDGRRCFAGAGRDRVQGRARRSRRGRYVSRQGRARLPGAASHRRPSSSRSRPGTSSAPGRRCRRSASPRVCRTTTSRSRAIQGYVCPAARSATSSATPRPNSALPSRRTGPHGPRRPLQRRARSSLRETVVLIGFA